jgi:polysaccharide deacetylase family protein (PEP-CTERM system associated)
MRLSFIAGPPVHTSKWRGRPQAGGRVSVVGGRLERPREKEQRYPAVSCLCYGWGVEMSEPLRGRGALRKQVLTVNVEDYFHVWAIRNSDAIRRKHWDRLDPRLDASLQASLDLLRAHDAKATFFVFGCIAETHPDLIERIMAGGHEVASRGFWPRSLHGLGRAEFVDDLGRAKLALERAGSNAIVGYRSPVWIGPDHLWMLEALSEAGYKYDSSVNPILRRFADQPKYFGFQQMELEGGLIWEIPITTAGVLGVRIAISGGNYLRQLPHGVLSRAVAARAKGDEPLVFYFMPWELDVAQPHISGLSLMSSLRQYRNLRKTRWVLERYLETYSFHSISDELSLPHEPIPPEARPPRLPEVASDPAPESVQRGEATLVVPIFNEEQNVRYLHRTLSGFRKKLSRRYRLHLVLVDDASTDGTFKLLQEHFGNQPDTKVVRHPHNRGVAAAILTGLREAPTDIVCSIDCDCSYDPDDLAHMLPMIADADMVTASPYHPRGSVLNVPPWRLFLSKSLSRIYSAVLSERSYTYTSCCRVYRKSSFENFTPRNTGFLGVAETLIDLKRRGGKVVEYPATLESRIFGESKMRVARTIGRHLGLIASLIGERVAGHTPEQTAARRPETPARTKVMDRAVGPNGNGGASRAGDFTSNPR